MKTPNLNEAYDNIEEVTGVLHDVEVVKKIKFIIAQFALTCITDNKVRNEASDYAQRYERWESAKRDMDEVDKMGR